VHTATSAAEEVLYFEDRAAIPQQYTWDLSLYFADAAAWDEAFAEVEAMLPQLDPFRGRVTESPKTMAEALETQFALSRRLEPLFINAQQKSHLVRSDELGAQQSGRVQSLYARLMSASAFIEPEIAALPDEAIAGFREAEVLAPYRHYLDNIWRLREHSRSPEVEEVVAASSLSGDGHAKAFEELSYADIEWPTVVDENGEEAVVTPGQFGRLRSSTDQAARQRAWVAHLEAIGEYRNTFAATLGSKIQRDVWLAGVHRFPNAVEAALAATNVPAEVMDTLVETVHENLGAVQGYNDLRRKVLGLERLQPWDTQVPLLADGGRSYTFSEAWELAMAFWRETFGDEFADIAQQALDQRWVDVYSNQGKRGGAYSWGAYRMPRYLFLNWGGKFDDVSTLVHEMGHSVHGVLADRNQSYHEADVDLFVAEVGSVASESLFAEWMLARSQDPAERRQVLDHALNSIRNTFVTQIFFHEWEARVHAMAEAGEALTADAMGQVYVDLLALYNADTIAEHPLDAVYWARIPHFYRNFYVWKYATSFAAGEALAARFRSGDRSAASDYLAMLKLGGSVYPLEVLKAGGVDLADPAVIKAVMERFATLQAELAREFGV
jgi:oligoendopeptidase F